MQPAPGAQGSSSCPQSCLRKEAQGSEHLGPLALRCALKHQYRCRQPVGQRGGRLHHGGEPPPPQVSCPVSHPVCSGSQGSSTGSGSGGRAAARWWPMCAGRKSFPSLSRRPRREPLRGRGARGSTHWPPTICQVNLSAFIKRLLCAERCT